MRLFNSTWQFFRWLGSVLGVFFRAHPVMTPSLVISHAISSIARLLAFFLPLKVLLLIATPGVPRYFRFFIDPELRTEWAVGLSLAAVGSYFLALTLDKLCTYWSKIGSEQLLEQSSQLSIIGNQRQTASGYFSRFTGLAANLLLALVIFAAGLSLYPGLFALLAMAISVQLVMSWAALRGVDPTQPRGFGGYIFKNTKPYLGYLEAFNFLFAFGLIVVDFLLFEGVNILIAILSFLMARQLGSALNSVCTSAVALSKERHRIDPLVFMEKKYKRKQTGGQQRLLKHFSVQERQDRLRQLLGGQLKAPIAQIESHWIDPGPPGMYLFEVQAWNGEGDLIFHGQEQVNGRLRQDPLENEALIIDCLGAQPLRMAPTALSYQAGDFDCRLLRVDGSRRLTSKDWKKKHQERLIRLFWRVDPGSELKQVFEQSRHYLPDRLTAEDLARMEVAVDTKEKRRIWEKLANEIKSIKEIVSELPVFPFNKAMSPKIVFLTDDDTYLLTDWGRWTLEPLGVGIQPGRINERMVAELEEDIPERLEKVSGPLLLTMRMAARAYEFEQKLVNQSAYNDALKLAGHLLKDLSEYRKPSAAEFTTDNDSVKKGSDNA